MDRITLKRKIRYGSNDKTTKPCIWLISILVDKWMFPPDKGTLQSKRDNTLVTYL